MKSVHSKVPVALLVLVSIVFSQSPISALALQSKQSQVAVKSKCTNYKFIGMRGSGQEFDDPREKTAENRQMGPEMASLYGYLRNFDEFKNKISFSGVPDYPAVAVNKIVTDPAAFIESLEIISTLELIRDFSTEVERCPDTKFIIAGYSQGAYAAHYLIKTLEEKKSYLRDSIVGAIFLASPSENKAGILKKNNWALTSNDENQLSIANVNEKFLKTLSFYKPKDIIADFFEYNWFKGYKIHISYCSPTGEFAPADKKKRSDCKAESNKDFLQESAIYIRGQLNELKRLSYQKRQNVLSWYGKDWVVPTTCVQIMTRSFSRLQGELSSEFEDNGALRLRILALNVKDSSIWFVNEMNSELVSYNSEDGVYSLEELEKTKKLFEISESFPQGFKDLSKRGLISNLVFDSEENWMCKVDLGMDD